MPRDTSREYLSQPRAFGHLLDRLPYAQIPKDVFLATEDGVVRRRAVELVATRQPHERLERGGVGTYVLDELAHAPCRDGPATEDLRGILRRFTACPRHVPEEQ